MKAQAQMEENDRLKKVRECFDWLKENDVYIGIPQAESSTRQDSSITQAELLYIHENGSPVRGIPARPVLKPSMEYSKDLITEQVEKVIKCATDGDIERMKTEVERLGSLASSKAKSYFTEGNDWTPNKPSTIKKKGSDKPLLDTATMQKAITHVVDKKGRGQS